jgi:hypothetical protein
MKNSIAFAIACFCGSMAVSNAFTLDFIGYEGTTLPDSPLVINVPGYGDVSFAAAPGTIAQVDSAFQNDDGSAAPSLSMDQGEAIVVTFLGNQPLNVNFDFVGVGSGEYFIVQEDALNNQSFLVSLNGVKADGAGIYGISWSQVPEPSSAMLGALGTALLVIRRRR